MKREDRVVLVMACPSLYAVRELDWAWKMCARRSSLMERNDWAHAVAAGSVQLAGWEAAWTAAARSMERPSLMMDVQRDLADRGSRTHDCEAQMNDAWMEWETVYPQASSAAEQRVHPLAVHSASDLQLSLDILTERQVVPMLHRLV